MRILLAAKHAPNGSRPIGGVQSWCRTVARELVRQGHTFEAWGPEQPLPFGKFDLGIIANTSDTGRVLDQCARRIIVSHGIIPAEQPFGGGPSEDSVVYTSEEVRDHWNGLGAVLRQPIDLTFWSPGSFERIYLTRFSYRQGLKFVSSLAAPMGLTYRHVCKESEESARDVLRKSACVLATGRAALEAMACGAPVVICDHRSAYQGPLMDWDIGCSMRMNYSGRGGIAPTTRDVELAINEAIRRGSMRWHVKNHHNVVDIVDQLLEAA